MQKLREMNPLHERFGYLSLVGAGLAVLLIGLLLHTDIALRTVTLILELLGWAAILGGTAIAFVGVGAYGNERGWWTPSKISDGPADGSVPIIRGISGSAAFLLALDDNQLL